MSEKQKVEYSQLVVGYEFPEATFQVDRQSVTKYLQAVGENSPLYQNTDAVPPMAVAALAMGAWAESVSLTSGAVHISQDFEFISKVTTRETLTSRARVTKKAARARFQMLTIDINVFNQKNQQVLAGKTTMLMPEDAAKT